MFFRKRPETCYSHSVGAKRKLQRQATLHLLTCRKYQDAKKTMNIGGYFCTNFESRSLFVLILELGLSEHVLPTITRLRFIMAWIPPPPPFPLYFSNIVVACGFMSGIPMDTSGTGKILPPNLGRASNRGQRAVRERRPPPSPPSCHARRLLLDQQPKVCVITHF